MSRPASPETQRRAASPPRSTSAATEATIVTPRGRFRRLNFVRWNVIGRIAAEATASLAGRSTQASSASLTGTPAPSFSAGHRRRPMSAPSGATMGQPPSTNSWALPPRMDFLDVDFMASNMTASSLGTYDDNDDHNRRHHDDAVPFSPSGYPLCRYPAHGCFTPEGNFYVRVESEAPCRVVVQESRLYSTAESDAPNNRPSSPSGITVRSLHDRAAYHRSMIASHATGSTPPKEGERHSQRRRSLSASSSSSSVSSTSHNDHHRAEDRKGRRHRDHSSAVGPSHLRGQADCDILVCVPLAAIKRSSSMPVNQGARLSEDAIKDMDPISATEMKSIFRRLCRGLPIGSTLRVAVRRLLVSNESVADVHVTTSIVQCTAAMAFTAQQIVREAAVSDDYYIASLPSVSRASSSAPLDATNGGGEGGASQLPAAHEPHFVFPAGGWLPSYLYIYCIDQLATRAPLACTSPLVFFHHEQRALDGDHVDDGANDARRESEATSRLLESSQSAQANPTAHGIIGTSSFPPRNATRSLTAKSSARGGQSPKKMERGVGRRTSGEVVAPWRALAGNSSAALPRFSPAPPSQAPSLTSTVAALTHRRQCRSRNVAVGAARFRTAKQLQEALQRRLADLEAADACNYGGTGVDLNRFDLPAGPTRWGR